MDLSKLTAEELNLWADFQKEYDENKTMVYHWFSWQLWRKVYPPRTIYLQPTIDEELELFKVFKKEEQTFTTKDDYFNFFKSRWEIKSI